MNISKSLLLLLITIFLSLFCNLLSSEDSEVKDNWDNLLSKEQQKQYGLTKLDYEERKKMFLLFISFARSNNLDESARQYVENQLGLSSEVTVKNKIGKFLFIGHGKALKMWSVYEFSRNESYLADDDYRPDQILDHDGEMHDVRRVYDEEEAYEELREEGEY